MNDKNNMSDKNKTGVAARKAFNIARDDVSRALHAACAQGDIAAMQDLIVRGADIDARYGDVYMTPLRVCLNHQKEEAARVLLAAGALVEGEDLFISALKNTPDITCALLARMQKDQGYIAPTDAEGLLTDVIAHGRVDMLKALVDFGLESSATGIPRGVLLREAVTRSPDEETAIKAIDILLDAGMDIDRASKHGMSAIGAAAQGGLYRVFMHLKGRGADMERNGSSNNTLLHTAAGVVNGTRICAVLLDMGFEVDARNDQGQTPLHIAAHNNKVEVVKLLLAAGANPLAQDRAGCTADMLCQGHFQAGTRSVVLAAQRKMATRKQVRKTVFKNKRG